MALTEHDLKIISVRELMKEREKARKDTNFALSDKLRDRLKQEFQVDIVDQVNQRSNQGAPAIPRNPAYPITYSFAYFLTYFKWLEVYGWINTQVYL